jgi:hypothetical protein
MTPSPYLSSVSNCSCLEAAVPEWEEEPVKDTESKAHYKDLHAKRPICNKIADTLKVNHTITYSRWMAK